MMIAFASEGLQAAGHRVGKLTLFEKGAMASTPRNGGFQPPNKTNGALESAAPWFTGNPRK
jgi:hypothetical protein